MNHPKHQFHNSEIHIIDLRLAQMSRRIRELLEPESGIEWEDTTFNAIAQFTQNINEHWDTAVIDRSIANAIRYSGLDITTLAGVMTRAGIRWSEFQQLRELIKQGKKHEVHK